MITFIGYSGKDITIGTEEQVSGCQGMEAEEEVMIKRHKGPSWGDRSVLYFDCGGGNIIVGGQNSQNYTLEKGWISLCIT